MAIAKMKHLQLIALQSDRERLMDKLLHLGSVEISDPEKLTEDPQWDSLLHRDDSQLAEAKNTLRQLELALDNLKKVNGGKSKGGLLAPRPQISETEFLDEAALHRQLELADEVRGHATESARLLAAATRLRGDFAALAPWKELDVPLESLSTRTCVLEPGAVPANTDFTAIEGALADSAPEAAVFLLSAGKEQKCLLLVCHRSVYNQALECLRTFGFTMGQLKGRTGTVEENAAALKKEWQDTVEKQEKEQAALMKLADRMDELQLCCDRMATRIQQEENRQRLLTDGCILAFEGWVPASGEKKLESLLAEFDCAYELREPTPEEYPEVPVKLNSNWLTRSMNCITEQYSLPAYDGVDPNPIMAPFFIFFFGMMMADMAYGLIMMIGTQVYLRKKRPADRSFMEMFFWCGISTFIFGALTGGFLGDFIPQLCKMINPASTFELPALFSPLNDTMAIMVGSLILGGIQIITGMTVSVVKKCTDGCFQDALWDEITWWVILLGGALAVLKAGSVAGVPVVLVVGIVMLVIGSGRGKKGFGKVTGFVSAVYNGVTGFFSDILSYVRLMALMLSGAVLAQVFNMLGATTGNIVTFVLISLIGNVLNLALNLLGCYVHDMRLQFLEFFGRFYKEGGKAYKPLSVQSKYVEILKEEK